MKMTLKTSILAGLATLAISIPSWKQTALTDIAKPHLGVYECTQARLGERDLLCDFTDVKIELKEKTYLLYYEEKGGKRKKVEGEYVYDKARGVLTVSDDKSGLKREFTLEKGKITVSFPIGKKECVMQFEQK